MPFTTLKRTNVAHDTQMRTPSVKNGLKWAAIGGVVLGFLGVMKISGNLNREFFAELLLARDGKTHEAPHHQQTDKSDSSNQSPIIPPGTEATIIIK
ncbi:uncharacterized protein LOC123467403 [Daphnia magna]|uniref:Uncharacterized protein n=1 Tax=Daphnia magna TaxID=35525 RepID=A0A0N8DTY7_9CRUS|nr:uncharacterized protein LOC123467403 [Daphnia magna]KZS17032.1 Uncharacterized protein APZ42_017679 [Daphnia magna]